MAKEDRIIGSQWVENNIIEQEENAKKGRIIKCFIRASLEKSYKYTKRLIEGMAKINSAGKLLH